MEVSVQWTVGKHVGPAVPKIIIAAKQLLHALRNTNFRTKITFNELTKLLRKKYKKVIISVTLTKEKIVGPPGTMGQQVKVGTRNHVALSCSTETVARWRCKCIIWRTTFSRFLTWMIIVWMVSKHFKHIHAKINHEILLKIIFNTYINVYVCKNKPPILS